MKIDSNTLPKLLNPDELAKILGISRSSVYRLVEAGQIPHYKVSGSLRFDVSDIVSYLEKNRVESIA